MASKDISNGGSGNPGGDGSPVWALLPRETTESLPPVPYVSSSRQRPEMLTAKPTAATMCQAACGGGLVWPWD